MFILGGARKGNESTFFGGWHWQAFAYSTWEQFTCVAMIIALTVLFRERLNRQGWLAREASASSYATYIIHTPIIILGALAVRNVAMHPLLKFVVVSLALAPLCFLLAAGIRRLPGARGIL